MDKNDFGELITKHNTFIEFVSDKISMENN